MSTITYTIQPAHLPRPVTVTLTHVEYRYHRGTVEGTPGADLYDPYWSWTTSYDGKMVDVGDCDTKNGARQDAEASVEPDVFSPLPDGVKPATALVLTAQYWLRAATTQPGEAAMCLHNAFNHTEGAAWEMARLLIDHRGLLLQAGYDPRVPTITRIDEILSTFSPEARVALGLDQPAAVTPTSP